MVDVLLNVVWLQHLDNIKYQKILKNKNFYSNGRMRDMEFLSFVKHNLSSWGLLVQPGILVNIWKAQTLKRNIFYLKDQI